VQDRLKRIGARLPTYLTYIRERPRWLLVLLLGRILLIRSLERWFSRDKFTNSDISPSDVVVAEHPDRLVKDIDETGVAKGLRLRSDIVSHILQFAVSTPCTSRIPPIVDFLPSEVDARNRLRERDIPAAYYFDRISRCDEIVKLSDDPLLRSIAGKFIGSNTHHIRTRLWWNFPSSRVTDADLHASAQEKYHFDLNDFRTIKFFFYLTDVDGGSGPHGYIKGSHKRRALKHQLSVMVGHSTEELEQYYGEDLFETVVGPAGTGFAEDPFIFHCGRKCRDMARLILEIEYGPYTMSKSYRYGVIG